MSAHINLYDRRDSFGWISIGLHWLTAAIVITMWILGKNIADGAIDEIAARRALHVTLGLSTWVLLAARIAWRLAMPHPRAQGQSLRIHRFARVFHYVLLAALGVMLLSGPLLAWLLPEQEPSVDIVRTIHAGTANILFLLVVIHVGGALKHLMFHHDDTIVRMLWPLRNRGSGASQGAAARK